MYHLKAIGDSNWIYSPKMLNSGQNRPFCSRVTLQFDKYFLKNNRAPLLCHFKLCASFRSHRWIQTGVTVRKRSIRLKLGQDLFWPLWYWPLTSGLNLLHEHHFCQWGLFLTISWWYDERNIVKTVWRQTDGRTDRQTDWTVLRAAWS